MTHPNGTQPPPTVKSPHQMEAARSDADQHLGPPVGGTPQNRPKNYGGESNLFASILKNTANSVPTGRVIKYPTKCALFAPPGGTPLGRGVGHPPGTSGRFRGGTPSMAENGGLGHFGGFPGGSWDPPDSYYQIFVSGGPGGPKMAKNGKKWPFSGFPCGGT